MNQSYGIIENESRVCIFEESRIHFILLVEPVSRFSLTSTLVPTHLLYTKMCRNYKCAACQINMYVKVATYHKSIIWEQNQFSRLLWLNEMCSTLLNITRPVCWATVWWNVLFMWKSSQNRFCSVRNIGSFFLWTIFRLMRDKFTFFLSISSCTKYIVKDRKSHQTISCTLTTDILWHESLLWGIRHSIKWVSPNVPLLIIDLKASKIKPGDIYIFIAVWTYQGLALAVVM